jgi:nuclear pore complex protein Nup54
VPTQLCGFTDLQKRVAAQRQQLERQTGKIGELHARINLLNQRHGLEQVVRLDEYRRKHQELTHKILTIMKMVQILHSRGAPLTGDEERLHIKLDNIARALHRPGLYGAKLVELKATVGSVSRARSTGSGKGRSGDAFDEETGSQIFQVKRPPMSKSIKQKW